MKVIKQDSLEFLKCQSDFENDIIFADPPYALGSEVIIKSDGKVGNTFISGRKNYEFL